MNSECFLIASKMLNKRKGAKNFRFNTALRRKDFISYKIEHTVIARSATTKQSLHFPLHLKNNMLVKSFPFIQ
ncbi:hypothetical protein IW22_11780 [Chryseobacterium sp. JM1]|nr:hypothetical protein IW22_11780 [Chryseobacterium sp. JM1]